MHDTELYRCFLGFEKPRTVKSVKLDLKIMHLSGHGVVRTVAGS
jgi:hypothetical protein